MLPVQMKTTLGKGSLPQGWDGTAEKIVFSGFNSKEGDPRCRYPMMKKS
jgi:hypothetical protein